MDTAKKELTELLANEYMDKIFYFCLKKTGNVHEAEDLSQDIALNIIVSLENHPLPQAFSAWAWKIARNRYAMWADKKRKLSEHTSYADIDELDIADEEECVMERLINEEQLSILRRELAFASSTYRNILVAYYLENKSIKEIANASCLTEEAVKQRLMRGRSLLKEGMNMTREFGTRSYNPDSIHFLNFCTNPGDRGQPFSLVEYNRLHENVFLTGYDNPTTAEEYALELGIALPYMEDILEHLVSEGVMIKNGKKFETAFPIISAEAQEKIHLTLKSTFSKISTLIEKEVDSLIAKLKAIGIRFYGRHQSYGDAKWSILLLFYQHLYEAFEPNKEKYLGSSQRPLHGIWDIIALEKSNEFNIYGVGHHHHRYGFSHYRIGYKGIAEKTPPFLSAKEEGTLYHILHHRLFLNKESLGTLEKYGYIEKTKLGYKPKIAVIKKWRLNLFDGIIRNNIINENGCYPEIISALQDMKNEICTILQSDLPKGIKTDFTLLERMANSLCSAGFPLGHLIHKAAADGWLKYNEKSSAILGAYFVK
ncbi:MAG: sigma-70 family RNA polymerase sigma factor [Clostridia bacterium]|nr:sigma-70 family RNA polymerase sigma factor [Clostridia bacterium]